jgi:hypothetical protein
MNTEEYVKRLDHCEKQFVHTCETFKVILQHPVHDNVANDPSSTIKKIEGIANTLASMVDKLSVALMERDMNM